jgi:hypothetical protein
MRRISIERYKEPAGFAGLIEGASDDGQRWILFIGDDGMPYEYFGKRDPKTGAVTGERILLNENARRVCDDAIGEKIESDLADIRTDWGDEGGVVTSFPAFEDDDGRIFRGRIYVEGPDGAEPNEVLRTFLTTVTAGFVEES